MLEYQPASRREPVLFRKGKKNNPIPALFFRNGLKTYFIPYQDIKQCFRRIFAAKPTR